MGAMIPWPSDAFRPSRLQDFDAALIASERSILFPVLPPGLEACLLLQVRNGGLRREIDGLKAAGVALRRENEELASELDVNRAHAQSITAVMSEKENLGKRNESLEIEKERLRVENIDLRGALETLRARIGHHENEKAALLRRAEGSEIQVGRLRHLIGARVLFAKF